MRPADQEWVAVGPLRTFRQRKGKRVEAHGELVAVFRLEREIFAIANACPHMGAELCDGRLDERDRVVCHWHDWTFELDSGRCAQRAWAGVRTFPVDVRDGIVWIGPPREADLGDTPVLGKPEEDDDDEWIVWDDSKHMKKPSGDDPEG